MSIAVAEAIHPSALAESLRKPLLRLSRRMRQEAAKSGVSAQDSVILAAIRMHRGIGVCDLADAEQISRPAMSGHIKRLEGAGLVVRTQDAADGRRAGLAATTDALRQLEMVRRRRNDWLAVRLARLTPAEREVMAAACDLLMNLTYEDGEEA